VADSVLSSDLSPDSVVTPRAVLPWFQIDELHISRFSRAFYAGGILDQRLSSPRPDILINDGRSSRQIEGTRTDDGDASDDTCVCPLWHATGMDFHVRRHVTDC
jgi:hypothetical protein